MSRYEAAGWWSALLARSAEYRRAKAEGRAPDGEWWPAVAPVMFGLTSDNLAPLTASEAAWVRSLPRPASPLGERFADETGRPAPLLPVDGDVSWGEALGVDEGPAFYAPESTG